MPLCLNDGGPYTFQIELRVKLLGSTLETRVKLKPWSLRTLGFPTLGSFRYLIFFFFDLKNTPLKH